MVRVPREEDFARLDREDPLASFRERFRIAEGTIYLDGNSLGALPAATTESLLRTIEREWGGDLIRSWNLHGWIDLAERIAARLAPLLGANAGEVAICDSISVNLFKLLGAAHRLRPGRTVVIARRDEFPTDLYVVEGMCGLPGTALELRLVADEVELEAALDRRTLLVLWGHVDYRTGRLFDLAALARKAHAQGAFLLADLAHSAGVMPLHLDRWRVDFAVGCGYKFLNGGPGAPAFLYVSERHLPELVQPISGWFGHARPFAFETRYRPAPGIRRFLSGTPSILALRALACGVELAGAADLELVRAKSERLTGLFIELVERELAPFGFQLASPRCPAERGSQVSFRHRDGYPIMQALISRGVVGDFRAPDILRFGFAPLYNRYREVSRAVAIWRGIMEEQAWQRPEYHRPARVT